MSPRPVSERRVSQRIARRRATDGGHHSTIRPGSLTLPKKRKTPDDDTTNGKNEPVIVDKNSKKNMSYSNDYMRDVPSAAGSSVDVDRDEEDAVTPVKVEGGRVRDRRPGPEIPKSEQVGVGKTHGGIVRDADITGEELVGREILICWRDGLWYDAVVVCYYPKKNEYKLVYRADDGIEILDLSEHRWTVAPKKSPLHHPTIVDGAIIRFIYPKDGKSYCAMIYDANHNASRVKVAYLDEFATDLLRGGGWEFIRQSPCIESAYPHSNPDDLLDDAVTAIKVGNMLAEQQSSASK